LAESPVLTLARLLGGVVLMQGRLGHQILGQMLVMNRNEVAVAGATAVAFATTGQRNAAAQIAIRTAVPALAVRGLLQKQESRIEWKETLLAERESSVEKRERMVEERERELEMRRSTTEPDGMDTKITAFFEALPGLKPRPNS
jgi:hypothetical protein